MDNKFKYFFFILILFYAPRCAHVISQDLRSKASPSLSFNEISANPGVYKGQTVVWGGEIIEFVNQKDGTSIIEVSQRPLDEYGRPNTSWKSEGRFLIKSDKHLDNYSYKMGTKITVGGEILGAETKNVGGSEYRYPLVNGKEIYSYNEPNFRDDPFYDPWWHYPYYSHPSRRHNRNPFLPF
jgi:outer membrane lipoprotein